jgi:acetoin:2,6-dichlorophenolindophenol oxidoreductase subunit alpha
MEFAVVKYKKLFVEELYKTLYTIRVFETQCVKLYRQGQIRGYFHPYLGEEAIATGVCAGLRHDDYIISTHRGHGHCIAKGANLDRMVAELFGKETGYCGGLGGSMHIADVDTGNIGANGIVGGGIPIGVGAALGISIRGSDQVVAIFFSDGASNNGIFAESLNLAAIWDLPVLFVLENNHFAVSTPIENSSRSTELYKRSEAYGVPSWPVDGNDVLKMYEATLKGADMCRNKKGPVLIEAKTYRHGGHHVNDPGTYMPKDRLEHYMDKDPLKICKQYILAADSSAEQTIEEIEKEIIKKMDNSIQFALASPEPSVQNFIARTEAY